MKKILSGIFLALSWTGMASAEDIELFPSSAGYTFMGDDIEVAPPESRGPTRTGDAWTLSTIATDRQGCYLSTPGLATADKSLITIVVALKRSFLGTIPSNLSLESQPYANLIFKRMTDGSSNFTYSAFPISLGILQRPLTVTPISQTPEFKTIYGTDQDTQVYSVILPNVEPFTQGTIAICDIFRFTGMELQSFKIIVNN